MAAPAAVTSAWRSWNSPARLHGVDLARALAVLGMLAAHLLTIETPLEPLRPSTWVDLVNGRSAILFAVLAGVSIALVTGGRVPPGRARLRTDRRRLAVRAGMLWLIGLLLTQTGVPVYVILPAYGILFLLALPFLSVPAGALWAVAASIAVLVPWILPGLDASPVWEGDVGETLFLATGWAYPFPLWLAFVLAGIALGRSDLRRTAVQVTMLIGGGAVAAGVAAIAGEASAAAVGSVYLETVLSAEAHSGGLLEAIGSGGFAVAVLGACLLVCRTPLTWAVLPLRALGSMPLTAYVGQILAWAVAALALLGDTTDLQGFRDLEPFWWFASGGLVFCTLWAVILGQGPFERMLAASVRRLAPRHAEPAAPSVPADRVEG